MTTNFARRVAGQMRLIVLTTLKLDPTSAARRQQRQRNRDERLRQEQERCFGAVEDSIDDLTFRRWTHEDRNDSLLPRLEELRDQLAELAPRAESIRKAAAAHCEEFDLRFVKTPCPNGHVLTRDGWACVVPAGAKGCGL